VNPTDIDLLLHLARTAALIALDGAAQPSARTPKDDGSPVTDTDLDVERALIEILARERPLDAVLAEESGGRGTGSRRWIIDPIDGTAALLAGGRAWGTHVALEVAGSIELGVITRPAAGVMWWAARGWGAHRAHLDASSGSPGPGLQVSDRRELEGAMTAGIVEPGCPAAAALARRTRWTEQVDCAVGALAEGRLDVVFDDIGTVWDKAPAVVIVEEAGGRFLDCLGGRVLDRPGALYTNGHLAAAAFAVLGPLWVDQRSPACD
jgi:histidinol-phosphatase